MSLREDDQIAVAQATRILDEAGLDVEGYEIESSEHGVVAQLTVSIPTRSPRLLPQLNAVREAAIDADDVEDRELTDDDGKYPCPEGCGETFDSQKGAAIHAGKVHDGEDPEPADWEDVETPPWLDESSFFTAVEDARDLEELAELLGWEDLGSLEEIVDELGLDVGRRERQPEVVPA